MTDDIREAMKWLPFSTAPKDGSNFFAYDADDGGGLYHGIVIARWVEADEYDIADGYESEWEVLCPTLGDSLHGCNLTHWLPFPLPPTPEDFQ